MKLEPYPPSKSGRTPAGWPRQHHPRTWRTRYLFGALRLTASAARARQTASTTNVLTNISVSLEMRCPGYLRHGRCRVEPSRPHTLYQCRKLAGRHHTRYHPTTPSYCCSMAGSEWHPQSYCDQLSDVDHQVIRFGSNGRLQVASGTGLSARLVENPCKARPPDTESDIECREISVAYLGTDGEPRKHSCRPPGSRPPSRPGSSTPANKP